MDLVEDLADPIVPIATACQALGVSRATLYRCTRPAPPRSLFAQRAPGPRRVSDAERATILDSIPQRRVRRPVGHRGLRDAAQPGRLPRVDSHDVPSTCGAGREQGAPKSASAPRVHETLADGHGTEPGVDVGYNEAGHDRRRRVPPRVRHHRPVQPLRRRLDGRVDASASTLPRSSSPRRSPVTASSPVSRCTPIAAPR